MTVDACFELGKTLRPHGTKGELLIGLAVDKPEHYVKKESVFIEINKKLVPFFIKKMTLLQNSKAILQLEDIANEEELNLLLNCSLYLPLTDLPTLGKGHFYYHQVLDYDVVDTNLGKLGKVAQIYEMPGQDMVEMTYLESEVLIPISDNIVLNADHEKKELYVNLPEGLLEVYLQPQPEQPDDAD
jgi:16S rRNA processing protein RimM